MYRDVTPLAGSLPQLLFHRAAVVEALLGKVHLGAKLSLEPVLRSAGGECTSERQTYKEGVVFHVIMFLPCSLVAILARDLQDQLLP